MRNRITSVGLTILLLMGMVNAVLAAAAGLLPPGEQTFLDSNGAPLAAGQVFFYIPSTSTPKTTWVDPNQAVMNANPLTLDAAGRAIIYGSGDYRQLVKDQFGVTIWDQLTSFASVTQNVAWGGTSSGTPNAQTVTASDFTTTAGKSLVFIAGFSNTGAMTLNPNGGGGINVLKDTTAGAIALAGGEVIANNLVFVTFDGTNFHIVNSIPVVVGPLTNLAAAATTDIGTIGTHNVNITGSGATITAFGSSASTAYSVFWLTFAGGNTLTHNASSLILPGGVNITTATGDTAQAMYLGGGNWRVISYTVGAAQLLAPNPPGGRLTLISGVPVMATDVTTSASIFYTPYVGNTVPIYNGTTFQNFAFAEQTLALNNPSHAINSNYDGFEAINGGALTICTGPAWTSDVARGTGAGTTELERKLGILVNKNSMTCRNGASTFTVAADAGTFVGTFRTSGSAGDTVWVANPAPASGGGNARLFLWNMYNRVLVAASSKDSTDNWTYATGTWQATNAGGTGAGLLNRVTTVFGLNEDIAYAAYQCMMKGNAGVECGIGLDSITAIAGTPGVYNSDNATPGNVQSSTATFNAFAGLGSHFFQGLDFGAVNGTFYGDNGAPLNFQTAVVFQGRM